MATALVIKIILRNYHSFLFAIFCDSLFAVYTNQCTLEVDSVDLYGDTVVSGSFDSTVRCLHTHPHRQIDAPGGEAKS